jgi:alkylated DNA repair dioxygenase AlkB
MSLVYQASLFDDPAESPELGSLGDSVTRIALEHGAWLDLRAGWVANSDAVFERLIEHVPWKADTRTMYDQVVEVPRLLSRFGPDSPYPDPLLVQAQTELNAHYRAPSEQRFTTAGLCFYRTGNDSVAWHGDRVGRTINRDTMVAIVSFGAARTLSLRPKGGGGETLRFPVGHGDLLVMGGSCQRTHEHAILKTKQAVGPRISVQFRPLWPK